VVSRSVQSLFYDPPMSTSNTRGVLWCSLALVLVLAGCSGSSNDKSSNTSGTPTSGESTDVSTSSPDSGGDSGAKIDACALLSDADAKALLGEPVTDKGPGSGTGESVCEWDTATEHSVTISVGSPGTAPGDKLTLDPILGTPEPVAALNGKGFYVAGEVDFAAGERDNYVQVVTDVTSDVDRPKAEQLAATLTPKIAQAS
jgi:Protein of unknown function (DUF3558)